MTPPIFCAVKGTVLAIERDSGAIRWSTRLPGGGLLGQASGFVNLLVCPDLIVAHASGRLCGLDPRDGRILWENPLQGYGFEIATLADGAAGGAGDPVVPALRAKRARDARAAGAASGA